MPERNSGYVSTVLLLLALILTACTRPATSLVPSQSVPSSAATTATRTPRTEPGKTPSEVPGEAPSEASLPTHTLRAPTHTPTEPPSAPPSDTPDPTAVLSTLEALRTETEVHLLDSPDGRWQAELISQVCVQVGDEAFIFYQLSLWESGSDEARILLQDLGPCGLGAGSYDLTAWSPDSQFLYYDYRLIPDGAVLIIPSTTYRVTATSGESTPLSGSGPVSPDQAQMVWKDGSSLILYDLNSGETQTFPALLPADLPTYLVWEPEGAGIIFVQTEQPTYPYGSSTVGRIELDGMIVQVLHEGSDPALIALQGFEPGGILMGDDQGRTWFLSIPGGELTQR